MRYRLNDLFVSVGCAWDLLLVLLLVGPFVGDDDVFLSRIEMADDLDGRMLRYRSNKDRNEEGASRRCWCAPDRPRPSEVPDASRLLLARQVAPARDGISDNTEQLNRTRGEIAENRDRRGETRSVWDEVSPFTCDLPDSNTWTQKKHL